MDNFKVIYQILKVLEYAMDYENFDYSVLSSEQLGITQERRNHLLIQMRKAGYIEGLHVYAFYSDHGVEKVREPVCPRITLKGLEYLSENSIMQRIAKTLKGVRDILPM